MATKKNHASTIEVVAGAGGAKGPGLIGAFRVLEERRVAVGKLTGVSIGSLMSLFYANGFDSYELEELYIEEKLRTAVANQFRNPLSWLKLRPMLGLGAIDLRPVYEALVKEYDLKPRKNLRIVAYNLLTRQPVVFEGTNYDPVDALAASCAVPFVMQPVLYLPRTEATHRFVSSVAAESMSRAGILVDGGVHHMQPSQYCKGPAIVFKLGTVSRLPNTWLHPIEAWFHGFELIFGRLTSMLMPDKSEDIVVDVGPKDVAGMTFSVSPGKCREMIDNGYKAAAEAIDRAINAGQVPTLQTA